MERLGETLGDEDDDALRRRAEALGQRARRGTPADKLMVETFALVREVSTRLLGLRHYDVQILGGVALTRGRVIEMRTGEGKTLVATLPAVLWGLYGQGVQVITVNDYLAARDAAWMGPIYRFFGLEVGVISEDLDPETQRDARRQAYAADITYVTNQELVFDYLRDNLALARGEQVLRPLVYGLVDELDLLLLDEATTPLIISGEADNDVSLCARAAELVAGLRDGEHFRVAHREKRVAIREAGWDQLEAALGVDNLAAPEELPWQHRLHHALCAHAAYERDVDYVVQGDEIKLIDEHTGRVSPDKRLSDGLHQALEAKEGLSVRAEDQTLAKVSYQLFFRLYPNLAGMTGTAYSARRELSSTYGLEVVVLPTHRPSRREDLADLVYRSSEEKLEAAVETIAAAQERGQPVLVGSTSVGESERLSALLERAGIAHEVLNAKDHSREAEIIAQAGRPGAVTVSTNMAGRGVDILLGGNPGDEASREAVREVGGLLVLGLGLHDAQRIDDQLRGRAGRQGDAGQSRFLLSLDDPVYRKFGLHQGDSESERFVAHLDALAERLRGHPSGEIIRDRAVLSTLRELRKKVEVEQEGQRREVLRYDGIVDLQRRAIYALREALLDGDGEQVEALFLDAAEALLEAWWTELFEEVQGPEDAAAAHREFLQRCAELWGDEESPEQGSALGLDAARSAAGSDLRARITASYGALDDDARRDLEEGLLQLFDLLWSEHLRELERLEDDVHLRGYAELDPLLEFRREAHELYEDLLQELHQSAIGALLCPEVAP